MKDAEFVSKVAGVADYWGPQMPMMAMEEAGEFIQAISKMERFYKIEGGDNVGIEYDLRKSLIDEIGDILISVKALQYHYRINDDEINNRIETKLNKKY